MQGGEIRLEALEDRLAPAVFNVTTLADGGPGSGSLRAAILGIADNLILCNHHFNHLATGWARQGKDPRDLRVRVGLRFCRIAFQMVAGRQVLENGKPVRLTPLGSLESRSRSISSMRMPPISAKVGVIFSLSSNVA